MSKGFRIFDNKNPQAMSEWDKINSAIMGGGGKRNMTSKDVNRFEEIVTEHDSSQFSDEATARHTPKHILEANGGTHWKQLEEYKPICSSHPTWSIDDDITEDSKKHYHRKEGF